MFPEAESRGTLQFKVAGDTLGSSLCIYLKRMHEVQRLSSTSVRNIHD